MKGTTKPRKNKPTDPAPPGETIDDIRGSVQAFREDNASNPTGSAKRKRGRPKGSSNKKSKAEEIPDSQAIAAMIKQMFSVVAIRQGKHWELSNPEAMNLAASTHAVILKYNLAMGPELALVIAVSITVLPRAYVDYEVWKMKREEKKQMVILNAATKPEVSS